MYLSRWDGNKKWSNKHRNLGLGKYRLTTHATPNNQLCNKKWPEGELGLSVEFKYPGLSFSANPTVDQSRQGWRAVVLITFLGFVPLWHSI